MAVPKSKISKSRRGMRRSHDKIKSYHVNISFNNLTGTPYFSHTMSRDGIYKGKKIIIKRENNKNLKNRESQQP